MKVYVLEDDIVYQRLMVKLLHENPKLKVFSFQNASSFLEAIRTPPDIITLDLNLPDMDGLDVLKTLKSTAPDAKVIAVSGQSEINRAVEILKLGAIDYVPKDDQTLKRLKFSIDRAVKTITMERELLKKQKEAEKLKNRFTKNLEKKVIERTQELENTKQELSKALEIEKSLNQMKSSFVATASHQFRTPLSVIQASMDILSMQRDKMSKDFIPVFDKYQERIKREIKKMTELMNEVLILGKINSDGILARREELDIVAIFKNIVDNFNTVNGREAVKLEVSGNRSLFVLDEKLLTHAVSNFISNGIKYSTNKIPVVVTVFFEKLSLRILISDHGIGIPEEELPNFFDAFYRGSNTKNIEGTGLGTNIAAEYIKKMNGSVSVKSKINEGTEIEIIFEKQNGKDSSN